MGDWPQGLFVPQPVISTASPESIGVELGWLTAHAAVASTTWPLANRIKYIPFALSDIITVAQLWCANGATIAGNVDMAVYDNAKNKIIGTAGAVAHAGASVPQFFNVTDTLLYPGLYYIALCSSIATATFQQWTLAQIPFARAIGVLSEAGAATALPATATPVAALDVKVPLCGLTIFA